MTKTSTSTAPGGSKSPAKAANVKTPAKPARKSTRRAKASPTPTDDAPLLIKKYPNRRLYNTASSQYIVLDDVVELVKENVPFVIEDTKTGEDITRSILNQIIFEQETKPSDFHFPLEFQKQLISMYGNTYGNMVPDYLTESLKLLSTERAELSKAVGNAIDQNTRTMMDYSRKLAQQNMDLWKRSLSMFGLTAPVSPGEENAKPARSPSFEDAAPELSKEEELEALQQQIDALQKRLKTLSGS